MCTFMQDALNLSKVTVKTCYKDSGGEWGLTGFDRKNYLS